MILLPMGFIVYVLLFLLMRAAWGQDDSYLTTAMCAFACTVAGMMFWVFVVLGFMGIPLSQLGLTLL